MKFIPGGPARFAHQRAGLRRLIETRGVCALLYAPGLGKTATTLDYLSLLALKSPGIVDGEPEARALIISPKAAVDTWVLQAQDFVSPQVNVWAEALGGLISEKAQTLHSRGPNPYRPKTLTRKKDAKQLPYRALNVDRAELLEARGAEGPVRGPGDLRGRPRLVILSTNLEVFASRQQVGGRTMADVLVDAVDAYRPDIIVVDEMHKIKGYSSNTSRLLARIGKRVRRRVGLTGTVMPHSPMDVFAQWRFIEPNAFGHRDRRTGEIRPATYDGFRRRYGLMGGFMGREVVAFQNLDEMQDIMAKNSIVARKEDSLDLPKMTDAVVSITLSPAEARVYGAMKKDLAVSLGSQAGSATAANKLTQMLRLRQITAGHLKDDNGVVQTVGTSKIDAIDSIANDTLEGEKRVVVFALFRHEIRALSEKLKRAGTEVLVIDGTTPQQQRLAIRQRFGSDDPARLILVAQVKTISLSVNELVTASNAIFASLSAQRDDLIQARDRLNRMGQTKPCTFWYVQVRGTVDEVIYRAHQSRTNLEDALLSHIQGTEEDGSRLSGVTRLR